MSSTAENSSSVVQYVHKEPVEELYKAALQFLTPMDTLATYQTITEEGKKLIGAKYATIFIPKGKRLIRTFTLGPATLKLKLRKNGYTYKAFYSGKPAMITIAQYREAHPEAAPSTIKTIFNVPLSNNGQTVGVLNIHSEIEYRDPTVTLGVLKLFGSLASMAIRKAQLYAEVKQALEARDLFISMAAHELRTPLTTITGYAQLLNNSLSKKKAPPKKWVKTLEFETLRLRRLMNELLQVDQIRTGEFKYDFEFISLRDVLNQAIKDFRFNYPGRKTKIYNSLEHDIVLGDFDKLLQVFINVLGNAAKYSNANTVIEIYLTAERGYCLICFKDLGKGITVKDRKHIFEGYYKGTNAQAEGLGLGLYITKKIITEHKGKIKVRSRLKRGTTIEIRLPRVKYSHGERKERKRTYKSTISQNFISAS